MLVLAVALPAVWLGVIAFIGMLVGAEYAVTAPAVKEGSEDAPGSGGTGGPGGPGGSAPTAPPGGGDFMKRMEERWEKRSGDDSRF